MRFGFHVKPSSLLRYTTFFLSILWQKKGLNNMNGNQPQRGTDSRRCVVASSIGKSTQKRIKMINFILIKGPANRNLMGINYSKLWHNPLKMNQNLPISDLHRTLSMEIHAYKFNETLRLFKYTFQMNREIFILKHETEKLRNLKL